MPSMRARSRVIQQHSVKRVPTKGTEIAALEAAHNEAQVRADGSLAGEKRVAIAPLALILAFGAVSAMRSGPHNWAQTAVGTVFSLYSALVQLVLLRVKVARPERAK